MEKKDEPKKVISSKPGTGNNKSLKPIEDPVENEWQAQYSVSEHWQSDLLFFDDELKFLDRLIDKYFMWLIDEQNIQYTQALAGKLLKLEKRRSDILQRLQKHMTHITDLIQDPFPKNSYEYREEHASLEIEMADFVKAFREIKKEVFTLTEQVIESEKAKHLLIK